MDALKKKTGRLLALFLLIGSLWGLSSHALASAGSKNDPLVSKSWVDQHINQQFDQLESTIAQLKQSAGLNHKIVLYIGQTTAYVDEEPQTLDVAPRLVGDYTMLPIRFVGEALEMQVDWSPSAKTVTCTKAGKTVVLPLDGQTATVDGVSQALPAAPAMINDRVLVPIRFVSESFGCKVDWNGAEQSVTIY